MLVAKVVRPVKDEIGIEFAIGAREEFTR